MTVILYTRVSTVRQADADISIPDQLTQMRDWCRSQGLVVAKEYIEPGCTATDDKRPVFQQMIDDATRAPHPFEAIIVHSQSRFYRDLYGALHYRRRLTNAGVRVISITQPTPADASGEMLENMIFMMDDYSSKENSKHTSRAMKENARRGHFNGSRAPYGYQVVDTTVAGHKGKTRKRLGIDEKESFVVRKIFDLYLNGLNGHPMGMKAIATHLNTEGLLMRGAPWRLQKIQDVLSDPTYRGEYCYNMRDSRKKIMRPESEWVRCAVDPIVDEATFDAARRKRDAQNPRKAGPDTPPPRTRTSPALLAGRLRCAACEAAMTLTTGKGGRYKYYKCHHKLSLSPQVCDTPNLPMERLDGLVLGHLLEKVLTPERVMVMIKDWRKYREKTAEGTDRQAQELAKALKAADDALNNLYGAIEKGVITLDSLLQSRIAQLKDVREKVLTDLALLKRDTPSFRKISPTQVAYACRRMKELLLDRESGYGKQLLGLLLDEVRVEGRQATLKGSYAALDHLTSEMKMGSPVGVPRFVLDWRARQDSNL